MFEMRLFNVRQGGHFSRSDSVADEPRVRISLALSLFIGASLITPHFTVWRIERWRNKGEGRKALPSCAGTQLFPVIRGKRETSCCAAYRYAVQKKSCAYSMRMSQLKAAHHALIESWPCAIHVSRALFPIKLHLNDDRLRDTDDVDRTIWSER